MIFLDANIFLRFLAGGDSSQVQLMVEQARGLFKHVERGDVQVTTSEVVIHQVCYILESKSHYGRAVAEIVDAVTDLLSWPGLWFPLGDKQVYLRALAHWSQHPMLGFADSVIAARCERSGHELATFDRRLAELSFLHFWQPESNET